MSKAHDDITHTAVRLRMAISQLGRRLRAGNATEGLGMAKLSVLGHLYRLGSATPSELATHEGVKLQSLTRLLADLEAERLVSRKPHPEDGRQTLLSLTRQGAEKLGASVRSAEASLAQAIEASLGPREQAALLQACALLDKVAEQLAAQQAEAGL